MGTETVLAGVTSVCQVCPLSSGSSITLLPATPVLFCTT